MNFAPSVPLEPFADWPARARIGSRGGGQSGHTCTTIIATLEEEMVTVLSNLTAVGVGQKRNPPFATHEVDYTEALCERQPKRSL